MTARDLGNLDYNHIMAQVLDGDQEAYAVLLDSLYIMLKNRYLKRFNQPALAEDLVQEVLLTFHQAIHTFNPERDFLPWFNAVAKYKMIHYLKKQNKYNSVDIDAPLIEPQLSSPSEEHNILTRYDVDEAIKVLPEKQQELIKLVSYEGHSHQEAADKLGISVSNAKTMFHRALKKLKGEHDI